MSLQSLDIISVNLWTTLISLANLLILYWILKRFLFKPVQKMFAQRDEQVQKLYGDAEKDRNEASELKHQYDEQMAGAREKADNIVNNARRAANTEKENILAEAGNRAQSILRKAQSDIEQEREQMLSDVRGEISDIAVQVASRVMEREIRQEDHEAFVDDFIRNAGDRK